MRKLIFFASKAWVKDHNNDLHSPVSSAHYFIIWRIDNMKKTITLTMIALGCLFSNAQASEKLAGNEILKVQKVGFPTKFTRNKNLI